LRLIDYGPFAEENFADLGKKRKKPQNFLPQTLSSLKIYTIYIFFRMSKLLKPKASEEYTDLIVGFAPEDMYSDEDLPSPPVRYYHS